MITLRQLKIMRKTYERQIENSYGEEKIKLEGALELINALIDDLD